MEEEDLEADGGLPDLLSLNLFFLFLAELLLELELLPEFLSLFLSSGFLSSALSDLALPARDFSRSRSQ